MLGFKRDQRSEAVDAVRRERVSFEHPNTACGAGDNADAGIGPVRPITPNLVRV